MNLTTLTDDELLRNVHAARALTGLELELSARLERALDEIDDLHKELKYGPKARIERRVADPNQARLKLVQAS